MTSLRVFRAPGRFGFSAYDDGSFGELPGLPENDNVPGAGPPSIWCRRAGALVKVDADEYYRGLSRGLYTRAS